MKTNYLSAAALIWAISVAAAPRPMARAGTFTPEGTNITLNYEIVDPSSPIAKRADRPLFCDAMVDNRDRSPRLFAWNIQDNGIFHYCLTASQQQICSADHYWEQSETNDIVGAMREQATKDGRLESSQVGEWRATFNPIWTSAIRERDPFVAAFAIAIAAWQNYGDEYKKEFYSWDFVADTPRPDKGADVVESSFVKISRHC